jgi:parallel beta-helix repeat protein
VHPSHSYIRSSGGNGIRTWKHSAPVVRHNLVHNCGNQALLLVSGHGHYTNNRFVDALGTAGVWIQGRSDATFTANLVRNNEGHGFYLGRETKVRVRGNEIYGNVQGNVAIHTDTAVLRSNVYRPGDISDRPLYTDTVSFATTNNDINESDLPNQPPEDNEIDQYEDPDRPSDDAPMFFIRASEKYKAKIQPPPSFGITTWSVRPGYKPAKGETNTCSTIADAIHQARAGDHIDVYPGTYIEDIIYPFPLNIVGRSREKVIIYPKERAAGISYVVMCLTVRSVCSYDLYVCDASIELASSVVVVY